MKDHKNVCYTVSNAVLSRLKKLSRTSGISVAGITRLIVENAIDMHSPIRHQGPRILKKRVISDVTIRIQKGIKVRIV